MDQIHPFELHVDDEQLRDLDRRLRATRWPDELPETAWEYGVSLIRVRALVARWRDGYDWRAQEAEINRHPQFLTTIEGQRIHFVHQRSPEPGALPLILTHGWPGSFLEFQGLLDRLTDPRAHGGDPRDAFHVVVPSLPGFTLSGPTHEPGWEVRRTARAWAELMRRLGYERYGAQGGDFGSSVAPELGRLAPDRVAGVHVNALTTIPPADDPEALTGLTPGEQARLGNLQQWYRAKNGYAAIQSTRPLTLAYGLHDSPAGQLAWNLEWFDGYGDSVATIPDDVILTNVALYWLTGTAGSAARYYRENAASWGTPVERSSVPTGVAVFRGDSTIRRFAERAHRVTRWREYDTGGHFAALQAPSVFLEDVRAFFRDACGEARDPWRDAPGDRL